MFTGMLTGDKGEDMVRTPFIILERKTPAGRVYMARFYDTEGKVIWTKAFPEAECPAHKAAALSKDGIIANAANPDAGQRLYARLRTARRSPHSIYARYYSAGNTLNVFLPELSVLCGAASLIGALTRDKKAYVVERIKPGFPRSRSLNGEA
jgi:hypothetical protein